MGAPVAVLLIALGVFAAGFGVSQLQFVGLPKLWGAGSKAPAGNFPPLNPSRPVRITIPSIKVAAPVHDVGLAADGSIAVPAADRRNEAGWYRDGPTPGQFGPAVLVGHVDTRTGPAVFKQLGDLRPGARIEIARQDGQVGVFEVNSVEEFHKDHLPPDRVYGDFSRPGLRLITCGGDWVGGNLGYADNIVVFASLVGAHRA